MLSVPRGALWRRLQEQHGRVQLGKRFRGPDTGSS